MAMYYSKEADNSAIARIEELIPIVSKIPGDVLSYTDAADIIKYLGWYRDAIQSAQHGWDRSVRRNRRQADKVTPSDTDELVTM